MDKIDIQAGLVEFFYGAVNLPDKMITWGQNENFMEWNFTVFHQAMQVLNQLDHDQGFPAAGCHPEAHAVNELLVWYFFALRCYMLGKNFKHGALSPGLSVCVGFVLFYYEFANLGSGISVGKSLLTSVVSSLCFASLVIVSFLPVVQVKRTRRAPKCVFLVVIQCLLH